MTESELKRIFQTDSSAIIAPAGHGKTEMIVDIVKYGEGRQLLLTHTNAGVDALKSRLNKKEIPKDKYVVTTIAAFCIKWCMSYENTANIDKSLSPLNGGNEAQLYYNQIYTGAKKIFDTSWAKAVLGETYTGVIVDEYQDCIQEQHDIILSINQCLPVRVLGDPMQGIFSFAGQIVDWKNIEYKIIDVETKPWRWQKTNPALGEYLMTVRNSLLPSLDGQQCSLKIEAQNESIEVISPDSFDAYKLLKKLQTYSSVVYITKWPRQQLNFCVRMPGVFQFDEKQDCDELFRYAQLFDEQAGAELALSVISFASECSTKVKSELSSYIKRLQSNSFDFSRIKNNIDFGNILEGMARCEKTDWILDILKWIYSNSVFKKYRKELFLEMTRSVKYANEYGISIIEATNHIRNDLELKKRYLDFKFLSSRTLLSKGLEFDCVIIDMTTQLSAKDFYVAMTRAMKKIYIISSTDTFIF